MLSWKRPPEQENVPELGRRSVGEDTEPQKQETRGLRRIQHFRQAWEGIEAGVQSRGVGRGH